MIFMIIFCFIFGFIFTVLGFKVLFNKEDYSNWKDGTGAVISIVDSDNSTYHKLKVEFTDENGVLRQGVTQSLQKNKQKCKTGEIKYKRLEDKFKKGDKISFKYKINKRFSSGIDTLAVVRIKDEDFESISPGIFGKLFILLFGLTWIFIGISML